MQSKINKQLDRLLQGEITDVVDGGLIDENDEEKDQQETEQELLPVHYEEKQSSLDIADSDKKDDYNFVRSNLYGLVGRTNAALELALRVGAMTEHPRALEVVANLIKTSSDVSKDLIELHRRLELNEQEGGVNNTQINNYYSSDKKVEKEITKVNDLLDILEDNEQE